MRMSGMFHFWDYFTCNFFKDSMKSIKVLGSIRLEKDMERRPSASDGRRPLISTEFLNYSAVQIVPITDLHIIILAHVIKLQAQHGKPWGNKDTHSDLIL